MTTTPTRNLKVLEEKSAAEALERPTELAEPRAEAAKWLLRSAGSIRRPILSDLIDVADPGPKWSQTLPENLRHVRRNVRRRFVHALDVKNAAKDLERLPDAGEAFHVIMRGNWHSIDLVPAVLKLADGPAIARLYVTTFSFNKDNAVELANLIDAGRILDVRFICSVYFREATRDVYSFLASELEARGMALLAMRNHAKLLLIELEDGRKLVVESSANLRSCRAVEQFALSHDAGLFDFHAAWIDAQLADRGARR